MRGIKKPPAHDVQTAQAQTTRPRGRPCPNRTQIHSVREDAHGPRGDDPGGHGVRGHVQPYFEGTIRQLAKTDGNCPGQKKTWRENGGQMVSELVNKTGGKYTAKDPHYAVVDQLRKDVQALRNQLGLTPTSLRRAKQEASHNQGKAGWMSYWKRPMIMRWNTRLHTRPRWMPMWKRVFPGGQCLCGNSSGV